MNNKQNGCESCDKEITWDDEFYLVVEEGDTRLICAECKEKRELESIVKE